MNRLALKSLMGNSNRSIHIVLAIALSIALIYSSFSVTDGLINRVTEMSRDYIITDLYFIIDPTVSFSDSKISNIDLQPLPENILYSPIKISRITTTSDIELDCWGVDFQGFTDVRKPKIWGQEPNNPLSILVGVNLASLYDITIGSSVEVVTQYGEENLIVTGIIKTSSQYDDGVLISLLGLSKLDPEYIETYNYIEIRTQDIKNLLSSYEPPGDLMLVPSIAMQDYILKLAIEVQNDLYLISAIITTLALISVTHTMYKILTDSAQELMILRSLGITATGLNWIIMQDTILLSLTGAIFGIILGNILTNASSIFAFIALKLVYTSSRFDWNLVTFCLVTALIVGLLGGTVSIILKQQSKETYGSLKQL